MNDGLPDYHLTIALGAWKPAHVLMPAMARMGALRLVEIGCGAVAGAGEIIAQPTLRAPAADAHKYRRGLLGVVAGAMPGAAMLAARAAQGGGAGSVSYTHLDVYKRQGHDGMLYSLPSRDLIADSVEYICLLYTSRCV